jgi:hypothetical protein
MNLSCGDQTAKHADGFQRHTARAVKELPGRHSDFSRSRVSVTLQLMPETVMGSVWFNDLISQVWRNTQVSYFPIICLEILS